MKNIQDFITEGKDEKFFNSIKSILSKDDASKMILSRIENYDADRSKHSQVPKILVKNGEDYSWYTLNMIDTDLDFATPTDMLGIFINRMFYPISNKDLLLDIVKKYNEE